MCNQRRWQWTRAEHPAGRAGLAEQPQHEQLENAGGGQTGGALQAARLCSCYQQSACSLVVCLAGKADAASNDVADQGQLPFRVLVAGNVWQNWDVASLSAHCPIAAAAGSGHLYRGIAAAWRRRCRAGRGRAHCLLFSGGRGGSRGLWCSCSVGQHRTVAGCGDSSAPACVRSGRALSVAATSASTLHWPLPFFNRAVPPPAKDVAGGCWY